MFTLKILARKGLILTRHLIPNPPMTKEPIGELQAKPTSLQWRHNERDDVSNHRRVDCLLNCLVRRRSKKTSKLRVAGLCAGNPSGTGNAENDVIMWYNGCETIDMILVYMILSWWRRQMETFSALLALCAGNSPVPGEFPTQRPVTRSFGVFFDLRQNKRLSKQSWGWWFETLSRPLWRHCNVETDCWLLIYWCHLLWLWWRSQALCTLLAKGEEYNVFWT